MLVLFSSFTYVFFFLGVVLISWALPARWTRAFLLLASALFYASWGPLYGLLLAGMILATWALGLAIARGGPFRGLALVGGVTGSLLALGYFKYSAFLWTQLGHLTTWAMGPRPWGTVEVVLPLGISFFTFQMISYLVDIWRGGGAERNLAQYALYISFFPQLIAGPIVRADELLPQLKRRPVFDAPQVIQGLDLFVRGMVKKIVLADNLATLSDQVFATPQAFDTWSTWVGVCCYAGQIYYDFSGYTDMARGCAKMLGLELPENFRLPYLSGSITEFWRRWHITLSRWLRDYLYISLGGNRHGKARQNLNLMLTMAFGGLWHGASWNFMLWGIFHGLLLILHKAWLHLTAPTPIERLRDTLPYRALATLLTFGAVCLGWVIFRAASMAQALSVYKNLFGATAILAPPPALQASGAVGTACAYLGLCLGAHFLGATPTAHLLWRKLPLWTHGLAWALALVLMYLLAAPPAEFIYFQF